MNKETDECTNCGSTHLEYMTRVTGFFSKVNNWNKGKIAERKDRIEAKKENKGYFEHGMSKKC